VDGLKLAELMIDHEAGVSARVIRVPKLDSDYFDEESAQNFSKTIVPLLSQAVGFIFGKRTSKSFSSD